MPINVHWHENNRTILHIDFQGEWTWAEMYDIRDLVRFMAESQTEYIHIISDMRDCKIPVGNSATHLRNFVLNLPENAREGLFVYLGARPDWKAHVTIFMRIYPDLAFDHIYVSSEDDALVGIAKKQEQLELMDELDDD
jgi:hypothetical protein